VSSGAAIILYSIECAGSTPPVPAVKRYNKKEIKIVFCKTKRLALSFLRVTFC
jgi:hypothetical protein